MAQEKESPLARWSRLKRESARETDAPKPAPNSAAPAQPAAEPRAPDLPPVDQLTPDSDFSGFMDPRVDERLRRLALKKLFSDPRLNVVDGLDDFAEDYSLLEDVSQELVAKLEHARRTLRRPEPDRQPEEKDAELEQIAPKEIETKLEEDKIEPDKEDGEASQDAARRQDT
jgi:Protein of unknown function (DUF3306)